MNLVRVTSKGQATIPRKIREECGIRPGDMVAFTVEGDRVVLRKVEAGEDAYLRGLEDTLSEWSGAVDEDAYGEL